MRVYVAGPMRNRVFFNFPEFDWARDVLLEHGFGVVSPADLDREKGFDATLLPPDTDWSVWPAGFDKIQCIERDVAGVLSCDAILMLPKWQESDGATAEYALAVWAGKKVYTSLHSVLHMEHEREATTT